MDNSLYMQNDSNCATFILVYIDDSVIRGEQLDTIKKVKDLFLRSFKMKTWGRFTTY